MGICVHCIPSCWYLFLTFLFALQVVIAAALKAFHRGAKLVFIGLWGFCNYRENAHAWNFLKVPLVHVLFSEGIGESLRPARVPFLCWLLFNLNVCLTPHKHHLLNLALSSPSLELRSAAPPTAYSSFWFHMRDQESCSILWISLKATNQVMVKGACSQSQSCFLFQNLCLWKWWFSDPGLCT